MLTLNQLPVTNLPAIAISKFGNLAISIIFRSLIYLFLLLTFRHSVRFGQVAHFLVVSGLGSEVTIRMEPTVLYHDKDRVKVGGVVRYEIAVDPRAGPLFVRVRNTELVALRAAYLSGPYALYCDMVPMGYNEGTRSAPEDEPKYDNHVKASSHFSAELRPRNGDGAANPARYRLTVMSEILFSRSAEVRFEVTIGTTKSASKQHGSSARARFERSDAVREQLGFSVSKADTSAIWQQPVPRPEPLHVCVLTHGLVSNVTADLLYVKDVVDAAARISGENIVCKGYTGNVCRTERGVKYLGRRVARWLVDELIPTYRPAKLSFIAHSLGGLIQTYALGYIEATQPEALKGIELVNFVALASPMLGISSENPGYVQFALNFGVVGLTGLDLGLSHIPGVTKPLLEEIPNVHTMAVLRRFQHRTLYANAVHDGIVPLRTASILYLDWRAIGVANAAHNDFERRGLRQHRRKGSGLIEMNGGEIALMRAQSPGPHNDNALEDADSLDAQSSEDFSLPSRSIEDLEDGAGQAQLGTTNKPSKQEVLSKLDARLESLKLDTEAARGSNPGSPTLESPRLESPRLESFGSPRTPKSPKSPGSRSHRAGNPTLKVTGSPSDGQSSSQPESPHGSRDSNPFAFLFGHSRHSKIIRNSQTVSTDDEDLDAVGEQLPRKTSLIESGMSLLMPPHPDARFITDPDSREDVIFHDRVYYQQDLPERRFKSRLHLIKGYKEKVEVARSEERIARSYHDGTSWRKVLVEMLPEAHNNIIVRRRFSNAYGWPVVHHVVREHFLHPAPIDERALQLSHDLAVRDALETDAIEHQTSDLWTSSSDSEPDQDYDPHRASMLKIIPS